jgi:hypothetical protein
MDRTTKILMMVIAAGLWANIGVSLLRPSGVSAQSADLAADLSSIESNVEHIAFGICVNRRIC